MDSVRRLGFLINLILLWGLQLGSCIEIDRVTTGVAYSAFVQRLENGSIPAFETTTLQNIKTMLEVISTKFTMVSTYGVGAPNVKYKFNVTYYEGKQGFTAEAASLINHERMNKSITVTEGVWLADQDVQMETEISVAFENAQTANRIYNGTVVGLVVSHSHIGNKDTVDRTEQAYNIVSNIKAKAHSMGLKVGTRQSCYEMKHETVQPGKDHVRLGAKAGFSTVKNDLIVIRDFLQNINPNIEVMGQTGWLSKGSESWQNINNMKAYWEIVNQWASQNNFTMWMLEAFDNPWKIAHSHFGWWKLRRNADINNVHGYAEKIYEPPEKEPSTDSMDTSPWVFVGVAFGVLFVLFIMGLLVVLLRRVKKLQAALTSADVREFMYGISDDSPAAQGGQVENALKFPYNKSYEISKDKLKIKRDVLLGTGQFGCVYKALIEGEDHTEVALKMAKHDCPLNALKSLLSEIKILTFLGKHPNIVSIVGAYTNELSSGVVYVATELCTLGSLEDFLRNNQINKTANRYANAPEVQANKSNADVVVDLDINIGNLIRWSHEIACGMEYLGTKHVVHADLATRNVLLAPDKTAKITDFGLSRRLYDYTNYVKKQQEPLPWRWMAIESLKRLEFSSQSDVWSYGVTLWEIFAMGDLPYPGLSWNLDFVDNVVNGLRMNCPSHATPEVYKMMVDCWHLEPKERPTFTALKLLTGDMIGAGLGGNILIENADNNTDGLDII